MLSASALSVYIVSVVWETIAFEQDQCVRARVPIFFGLDKLKDSLHSSSKGVILLIQPSSYNACPYPGINPFGIIIDQMTGKMNNAKAFTTVLVLASILGACSPRTEVTITPTQILPTETSLPSTATLTFTPLPTETLLPTETASPTPPSCAVPVNPAADASVPAKGPFDFTWSAFEGASNYVVSIGPAGWYPTNFPVTGTTLTRYMETFPNSSSYEWSITAMDSSGREICKAGPYKFTTSNTEHATPSFTGAEVAGTNQDNETVTNLQSDDSVSTPNDYAKILSITDLPDCYIKVTVEVRHSRPIGRAVVQIRTDTTEDSVDSGFDLFPVSIGNYPEPSIYERESPSNQLARFKNGQVVYLTAFFWDNTPGEGLIYNTFYAGDLVPHTIATCSD